MFVTLHALYKLNVGIRSYHFDTFPSEKTSRHREKWPGLRPRVAPLPPLDALSHGTSWARRSQRQPSKWQAARAAQRLDGMVSIVRIDSIVLQSIHLDGAVLVPVRDLSFSLLCMPALLPSRNIFCS